MKQIAYSKVVLPSGEVLKREVVVFDNTGYAYQHFPLQREIAFTEWHNKTFYWPSETSKDQ